MKSTHVERVIDRMQEDVDLMQSDAMLAVRVSDLETLLDFAMEVQANEGRQKRPQ